MPGNQESVVIRAGTTLKDRYEIKERIAKGGFATVYTAWDKTFERIVAIKVVDLAEDENGQLQNGQELLREARVVAASHHANVLDVYDFGDVDDQTYLVMPFADGGTLYQVLRETGPFSFEQTGKYLDQIASGLDHAHHLKVVHRDLKPQNLLLFGAEKEHLVISDFGVARAAAQSTIASLHMTGTPRYMAPEQFLGRASYSSDIYSLGVLLYQMLTGVTPFSGDQAQLMYAHANLPPPALNLKRPDAPPALNQLIQRTMAKDPAQRPKSARELAHLYQQILLQMHSGTSNFRTLANSSNPPVISEVDATLPFATPTPPPLTPPPHTPSSSSSRKVDLSQLDDSFSAITPFNFTPSKPSKTSNPAIALDPSVRSEKKRLPLLIGVMAALVIVIVVIVGAVLVVIVGSSGSSSKTSTVTSSVSLVPSVTPETLASPNLASPVSVDLTLTVSSITATTVKPYTPSPTPLSSFDLPSAGDPALTATLEVWTDVPQNPEEWNVLAGTVAAYKKLFPNVTVNLKPLGSNEVLQTKFPEAVLAGNGPDLVIAPVGATGDWVQRKAIQPLDSLLSKAFLQGFEPNALAGSTFTGVGYGLPYNYGNILVLYYNKKLAPNPPSTFDELIQQAQALTKSDGSQVGLGLDRYSYFWLLPFLNAFGGSPVDNAGQATVNTTPMQNALQYFKDLTVKYKAISPTIGYDEANRLFISGKLAFFINGDWELNAYLKDDVKSKVDLGIAPLPLLNERTPRSMTGGRHYFLSSQSKGNRLKAALYFLQFQAREDQQKQLLSLGLLSGTKAILNGPDIKNNPAWAAVVSQLKDSQVQPVGKDINKVWTAMEAWLKPVQDGTTSPADAAKAMQEAALKP
ncbi:MAG: serine/threonine-protein kinase [Chloroflexota bacterium]|nr:extracellular solute-binding protein [Chloroflexota bacterium]